MSKNIELDVCSLKVKLEQLDKNICQNTNLMAARLKNQADILKRLKLLEGYCDVLKSSHDNLAAAHKQALEELCRRKQPWYKRLLNKRR